MLCDNLEELDGVGSGSEVQEGEDTYILWLIYVDIWQKPTQYCNAIILQLKINKILINKKDFETFIIQRCVSYIKIYLCIYSSGSA